MQRFCAMIAMAAAVTGCQSGPPRPTNTPDIKAADRQSVALIRECRQRHAEGELTLTQSVQCSSPQVIDAFEAAHYPYMDLIRLGMQARLAGAEKVDAGALSERQYDRQLTELRSRVAEEMRHRNTEAAGGQPALTETVDPATRARMLRGLSAFADLQ
jgi:hypothetical protein